MMKSFWTGRSLAASDSIASELRKEEPSVYYLEDKLKHLAEAIKGLREEQDKDSST